MAAGCFPYYAACKSDLFLLHAADIAVVSPSHTVLPQYYYDITVHFTSCFAHWSQQNLIADQMAAAFYQVLIGLKPTFDLEYPDNFRSLMKVFNWIDLDWDHLFYPEGEPVV